MIKKFTLTATVFAIAAAFASCNKTDLGERLDQEKGHFKITLSNAPSHTVTTSAFWPQTDQALGEDCERAIHNLSVFVYKKDEDKCTYRRNFSAKEIEKTTAIFSLPENSYSYDTEYNFYAVANYIIQDVAQGDKFTPTRTELLALTQTDLTSYMGINSTNTVSNFIDIYPSTTGPAVALRDDAQMGKGFVMSSTMSAGTVPANKNTPYEVKLELSRVASKIEIQSKTTTKFDEKYTQPYGSTLIVDTVMIVNAPTLCQLITPATMGSALAQTTIKQIPGTTKLIDRDQYNSIIYSFENAISPTAPTNAPVLKICATFDFDGKPGGDDISKITYEQPIKLSGSGAIMRNTSYRISVAINGLTSQEIITSIEVMPWNVVPQEDVEFGS